MARGRMINSKITLNKAVNDLSDDTSRLAFTWLITFADVEGRTYGDPAVVRSMLFPRRTDITVEQMEGYIREWHDAGLVIWYEADDDQWIAFPKFDENQRGLDRRKEQGSTIPEPNDSVPSTGQVRTDSVPGTRQVPPNRTEQKSNGREGSGAIAPARAPRKPSTPSQPKDERRTHLAVQAVKSVMGRWPRKEVWDRIIREVGDKPDLKKMRECYEVWQSRGHAPDNLDGWLFDWYFHGIREQVKGGSRASPGNNGHARFTDPSVYEAAGKEWNGN
jgi:hypothetical protein